MNFTHFRTLSWTPIRFLVDEGRHLRSTTTTLRYASGAVCAGVHLAVYHILCPSHGWRSRKRSATRNAIVYQEILLITERASVDLGRKMIRAWATCDLFELHSIQVNLAPRAQTPHQPAKSIKTFSCDQLRLYMNDVPPHVKVRTPNANSTY